MAEEDIITAASKAEIRRTSKPLMEKRRRARINTSLMELKTLVLELFKNAGLRSNKMEKADILEATVKYLRQIQRQELSVTSPDDSIVLNKYQNGFRECVNEVTRYLSTVHELGPDVRVRLLNHMANCVNTTPSTETLPPPTDDNNIHSPGVATSTTIVTAHVRPLQHSPPDGVAAMRDEGKRTEDINNNNSTVSALPVGGALQHHQHQVVSDIPRTLAEGVRVINGLSVLSGSLGHGNITLVIPAESLTAGGQINGYVLPLQLNGTSFGAAASGAAVVDTASPARNTGTDIPSNINTVLIQGPMVPPPYGDISVPQTPLNLSKHVRFDMSRPMDEVVKDEHAGSVHSETATTDIHASLCKPPTLAHAEVKMETGIAPYIMMTPPAPTAHLAPPPPPPPPASHGALHGPVGEVSGSLRGFEGLHLVPPLAHSLDPMWRPW